MGQSYDKLLLAVVLGLLLLSAVILLTRTQAQKSATVDVLSTPGWTGKEAAPVNVEPLTNLMAALKSPLQIAAQNRRMMVGELRVASIPDGAPIPYNATQDPFSGAPQPTIDYDPDSDGDGLTDKVEAAAGLNPADPSDAQADIDGDGYTNAEEIQMGGDFRNAAVYPPPVAKLRLVRTVVKPFKFRFLGVSRLANGERYQLNLRSLEKTFFAKLNEVVDGYTVAGYEEKTPDGPVLTLAQGESIIRLVQGRVINQEARSADLIFLLDGSRFRRQIGDDLKLKDLVYKVVDIKADRVVLRDDRDGKESVVVALSGEERMRMQSEANSSSGAVAPAAAPSADPAAVSELPF
jgi:hypothetical protein